MESAAEYVSIDRLKPAPDNPRINDHVVDRVVKSIESYGFGAPIVAQMDGTILAGHTRWKAGKKMKLEKVPCRFMDIEGDKARLYRIADNKLSELAEWDMEMLERELEELSGKYRLELNDMGFDEEELLEHLEQQKDDFRPLWDQSGEIDHDSFDGFERQCPRCKFEWND